MSKRNDINRRKKIEDEDDRNERLINSILLEEESSFNKLKKFAPIILLAFLVLSLFYILYSALTPKTEPPATVFI